MVVRYWNPRVDWETTLALFQANFDLSMEERGYSLPLPRLAKAVAIVGWYLRRFFHNYLALYVLADDNDCPIAFLAVQRLNSEDWLLRALAIKKEQIILGLGLVIGVRSLLRVCIRHATKRKAKIVHAEISIHATTARRFLEWQGFIPERKTTTFLYGIPTENSENNFGRYVEYTLAKWLFSGCANPIYSNTENIKRVGKWSFFSSFVRRICSYIFNSLVGKQLQIIAILFSPDNNVIATLEMYRSNKGDCHIWELSVRSTHRGICEVSFLHEAWRHHQSFQPIRLQVNNSCPAQVQALKACGFELMSSVQSFSFHLARTRESGIQKSVLQTGNFREV